MTLLGLSPWTSCDPGIVSDLVGGPGFDPGASRSHHDVSFRVPTALTVSSRTQNTIASCPPVSSKFRLVPEMRDPAVIRRDAHGSHAKGLPQSRRQAGVTFAATPPIVHVGTSD
jgi:hypothetical protein